MAEPDNTIPTTPLTDRTLTNLRKLAHGNGLSATDITLLKTDEKIITMEAGLSLRPTCEQEKKSIAGLSRPKGAVVLGNFAALYEEAANRKKAAESNTFTIVEAALEEVRTHANSGWGLDDAKITLPKQNVTLIATETCPTCRGQKSITCHQCQGQGFVQCPQCTIRVGEELCFACGGMGANPQNPTDRCIECNGTQWSTCRQCVRRGYARGTVPCPSCETKRTLICHGCNGAGVFSEEIKITYAAQTIFRVRTSGLPSMFNRTLDRIGLVKLGEGHGDIETYTPTEDEEFALKEARRTNEQPALINYRAKVPFAEIKVGIKGRPAIVHTFGKRAIVVSTPDFLDTALELARDNLALVTRGKAPLESATQARAIREAINLHLRGIGTLRQFRKLYPYGLSREVAQEIMNNARRAINRTTLIPRTALACGTILLIGGGAGYARVMGALRPMLESLPHQQAMLADFGLIAALPILGWLLFTQSFRLVLITKFPDVKHALMPKIGKTGMAMLAALLIAGCGTIYAANPLWLQGFIYLRH